MSRRVYKSRVWEPIRRVVLARAGYRCEIGLPGCLGVATAVDHIVELWEGGAPFDLGNLQAACKPCNSAKSVRRRAAVEAKVRAW